MEEEHKDRRKSDVDIEFLKQAVAKLEEGHKELKIILTTNTAITAATQSDLSGLIEFFKAAKLGIAFLIFLGKLLKWAAGAGVIIATIWGLWVAVKTGTPPQLPPP